MRTRLMVLVAALLLTSVTATAQAQNPQAAQDKDTQAASQKDVVRTPVAASVEDIGFINQIDFGVRGTDFAAGSDQARFQRYQDLRNGATLDRFRFVKDTDSYLVNLQADHIGYRDQRFSASYNNYGRVKASFEWNQTPIDYSYTTQTLYNTSTPGLLTLPDAVQTGVQNKTLTLPNAMIGAAAFNLQSRRDVADFRLQYFASPQVAFNVAVKNTQRNGMQPWGGSFGIGGSVDTELPVPIDTRTTEVGGNLEWSNGTGYARVGYDGSFFHNNVPTLTWDNPLRVSDSPTAGPVSGRMSLWPNTNSNAFSADGGVKLPGRSHASAFISVTNLSNNDPLIPFTDNTALVSPALSRSTADVHARVTAMNVNFTSRPATTLWFSARYRQYNFDNQTIPFAVINGVNYDTSIVALNKTSEPLGYIRHTFDADASYSPFTLLGVRAGYTREQVDRTYRVIENTTEDIARASVDLTGITWLSVRGVYEYGKRVGSPIDQAELLSIGEQPSLRQYDIADRNRNRVNAIVVVTPVSQFSVNVSAGVGKDDYPATDTRTVFGLRNTDNHIYTAGFDFVPFEKVSFGASYGYERNTALESSRTANPLTANTLAYLADPTQQFNDPRRDWTDNSADRVDNVNVSADFIKLIPKFDLKLAFDYTKSTASYTYGLAPNTVVVAPVQLPNVVNELQRGTVDTRYFVSKHLALGLVYWFDKYAVNDFALNALPGGLALPVANPAIMMMGYTYAPYTANTFMGRLTYLW